MVCLIPKDFFHHPRITAIPAVYPIWTDLNIGNDHLKLYSSFDYIYII